MNVDIESTTFLDPKLSSEQEPLNLTPRDRQ